MTKNFKHVESLGCWWLQIRSWLPTWETGGVTKASSALHEVNVMEMSNLIILIYPSLSLSRVSGLSTELVSPTLHDVFPLIPSCWMCHDTSPHVSKTAYWTHLQCCGQTRPKLQSSVIWICYSSLSCGRGDCALGACCIQGSLLVPPLHNAKTSSSCLYGPHRSTVVFVCDCLRLYPPCWLGTCLQLPEACRKWHPPQSRAFRFNAFHTDSYKTLQPKVFGQRSFFFISWCIIQLAPSTVLAPGPSSWRLLVGWGYPPYAEHIRALHLSLSYLSWPERNSTSAESLCLSGRDKPKGSSSPPLHRSSSAHASRKGPAANNQGRWGVW